MCFAFSGLLSLIKGFRVLGVGVQVFGVCLRVPKQGSYKEAGT